MAFALCFAFFLGFCFADRCPPSGLAVGLAAPGWNTGSPNPTIGFPATSLLAKMRSDAAKLHAADEPWKVPRARDG